jgi:cysteine desulfurase/selenocysteine lyase
MIDRIAEIYSREYARVEEGHTLSNRATEAFESTRARVAELIHANEPREVIFCRGATEALNLIARAFEEDGLSAGKEVLVTQAEHHSNFLPWMMACRSSGATFRVVPVDRNGDIDVAAFEQMLTDRVKVVSFTHVTGGIAPVKELTAMAKKRGIPVMVDGAQAVPHLPVDVQEIGCDFYAGSGHKMGGPSSVGFLWGRAEWLEKLPTADAGSTMAERVTL